MLYEMKRDVGCAGAEQAVHAVLFDLDCTITDRRRSVAKAADLLLRKYSFQSCCSQERLAAVMWNADQWGYRDRKEFFHEIIDQTGWVGHPPMAELLRFWSEDHPTCAIERDDAAMVLETLREQGIKTGIVTNGEAAVQAAKIRQLGLEKRVDTVVISGALGVKKPDARIYYHALAQLGVEPRHALFVGDHPENDIAGSQRAGLRGLWIPCGEAYPKDLPRPWRTIQSLTEVLGVCSASRK